MKTTMSVAFTFREKLYFTGPMKAAKQVLLTLLVLETLLVSAFTLCQTVLIPNQAMILTAIRLAFLFLPLLISIPIAVCNRSQNIKLTFPVALTFILMHLCANIGLETAAMLAPLHNLLWWFAPVLAVAFMVAAMKSMKGIITQNIYTTCELWDTGDKRYIFIEQKFAFFRDRKIISCNRTLLPLKGVRKVTLSENEEHLEIQSLFLAPTWEPEEKEYINTPAINTFSSEPVRFHMIPRAEKDKAVIKQFHDTLQSWLAGQ